MATPETPATPAPENAYDTMASVFDGLMAPNELEEGEQSTEQVETPPVETPPVETPAAETPPVETPAAETPPVETPAAETPPVETPAEEIDWKARAAELEAQLKARPAPAPVADTSAPTPARSAEPAPIPKLYSADEEEFLTGYEKEWPDIVKGEALKRRAEYGELIQHVFAEVNRVYGPLVERGAQAADNVAENATIEAIRAVHDDYDVGMYDAVTDWVETKLTGVKQRVAKEIISGGEPQDVIDLITDFKSTNARKPRVVADPSPRLVSAPSAVVTELSAKAKQAAKAMSVVDSKRTSPAQPAADPDDFDGAWADAVGSK